jgi:LytTr DNA-binding domain
MRIAAVLLRELPGYTVHEARNAGHETPVTEPEASQVTRAAAGLPAWAVNILKLAGISLALGIVFAWFGVYQTSQFPFPDRVAYWTLLMFVGAGASTLVNPLVFERWLPGAHPAVQIAVVSAAISVPITTGLVIMEAASDGTLSEPSWWWQQYFYVIVLSAIMTTGAWGIILLRKRQPAAPASAATGVPATTIPATAFTERLPVKFRTATIYAVSAEDHYLRVHSSAGEHMLLLRLGDAMRELGNLEGLQTHRSWWVARQGLAETAKGDGRVTLKLKSGVEAPVSRTYQKAVKDAGWL